MMYHGAAANGLLVASAAYGGRGGGKFYFLHILDDATASAFDEDRSTYRRLNLTLIPTLILGDRW